MDHGSKLLRGDLSQLPAVMGHFLLRTAAISTGIALSGQWGPGSFKHALGGSAAVQAFAMAYSLASGPETDLPSGDSAHALVRGDEGSGTQVIGCWLGRSTLIGVGMHLAGARQDVAKQALAAGASIEAFVLAWAQSQKDSK